MVNTSPFYQIREHQIFTDFDEIDRTMLQPWVFFNSGKEVTITDRRGRKVHYGGTPFSGSAEDTYWDFFTPTLKDSIVTHFEATIKHCKDMEYFDPAAVNETEDLLKARTKKLIEHMVDIDRRLRGKGYPDKVTAKDPQKIAAPFLDFIEINAQAAHRVVAHMRPSWFKQNRWWFVPVVTSAAAATVPLMM